MSLENMRRNWPELRQGTLRKSSPLDFVSGNRSGAQNSPDCSLLERLAELPEPRDVLSLRPAEHLAARVSELLEKSQREELSASEEAECKQLEFAEHLARVAKSQAPIKLQRA